MTTSAPSGIVAAARRRLGARHRPGGPGAGARRPASRLAARDLARVGTVGLRARPVRAVLSGLGICIGVASIVGVLGISQSSKTALLDEIGRFGNLLVVSPGQTFTNQAASLPPTAPAMISRIGPVSRTSATAVLAGVTVRRSAAIPPYLTGSIQVEAADTHLADALDVPLLSGTFLTGATSDFPTVVLGHDAAQRLGVTTAAGDPQVYLGAHYFTVVGILDHATLVNQVDGTAFVGVPIARRLLGYTGNPTAIYVRTDPTQVEAVAAVLQATASPASPQNALVGRPTDTLNSQLAAKSAFTSLFVGLGAVALVVGGVGIANIMVIGVLERRNEIGLRRALGAGKRHIGVQFLTEAVILSVAGGVAGTGLGLAVTIGWVASQHAGLGVPLYVLWGGPAGALVIGAAAGLYPAARAARLTPTEALRAT